MTQERAIEAVRAGIRAGILNDLGSGNHVDILVIDVKSGLRQWREQLKRSVGVSEQSKEILSDSDLGELIYPAPHGTRSMKVDPSLHSTADSNSSPWVHIENI